MGKIFIVRHGETEWNSEGRIQGHTDISLSERGRQQAQAMAQRLADVHFHCAYSSDLRRTSETARIILEDREVPYQPTPLLREYHKGVFEGLTPREYRQQYPDLYEASLINDLDFAPPGGETIRQASARLARFVEDLRERHINDDVLLVGHGGTLRCCIVAMMGLPLEANWKFVMGNCNLSIFDLYPNNAVMRLYNDDSHLRGQ